MAVTGTPTTGDDTLAGDGADDEIIGQQGSDTIVGGAGADTIYGDVKFGVNGPLDSDQGNNGWSAGALDGWYNTGSGGLIERWGAGFQGLTPADGSSFVELDVNGGGGVDHLQTDLQLETGLEYVLTFDAAARGGGGVNDDFEVTHNGVVIATFSPTSTASFTTYSVTITGLSGTDTIGFRELASQNNSVGVLLDNMQISLSDAAANTTGFDYDDVIDGGAGDDTIYGQEGDDRITGGSGNDFMAGGVGNDVFVLADGSGSDVVDDFVIGEDLLDVQNLTDSSGNPVDVDDATVTSDGQGGSILTFPNGEVIRLRGIDPADLDTNAELRAIGIPCLTTGAMIRMVDGLTAIEDLVEGDMVATATPTIDCATARPVRRIFRRKIDALEMAENANLRPIRISRGSLGGGLPEQDLLVSRQHRMLVRSKIAERMFGGAEVLVPAIKLVKLPGIFVDETVQEIEYFHLVFDHHEIIYANGAPTESLLTGKEALKAICPAAKRELQVIFPEILDAGYVPKPARFIPEGKQQRKLVDRHLKNNRAPLCERFLAQMGALAG